MTTYISGTGVYDPTERITNEDLAKMVETSDEWIQAHTGIGERRRAPKGWLASDLGVAAIRDALSKSFWTLDDIDCIACATSTPDNLAPSTACYIGNKLGISPPAFDLNGACAGFLYGLSICAPMIEVGRYRRVALVASEHYTRYTNYKDRATCVFWGDAAACVLLQPEKPERGFELIDYCVSTITEGVDYAVIHVRGHVDQDGPMVMKYALRGFVESAETILKRNALTPEDLAAFVGHQANYRLLQAVIEKLGIPKEKHWHTVRLYGNRGAAGAPATLIRKSTETAIEPGQIILMTVFGAGFTTASALFRTIG